MIRKYLSRLNFGYERTLLYMLQQTEYNVPEYLKWLRRVKDFREVRKRGNLIPTTKVKLIFLCLMIFVFIYLAVIFDGLITFFEDFSGSISWGIQKIALLTTVAIFMILALPIIAQYVIVLPLFLGDFLIKKPLAKKRITRAKEILHGHKGYRIAIAGSFGKTTAKSVLATVLAGGKKVAATPGNINQPLGFAKFIAGLDGDEKILIFEFGEYRPGDILEMCDFIQPDAGFITGINDAHLANFASRDELVADIMDLKKYLDNKQNKSVIASATKQSSDNVGTGLPRRVAPRNDNALIYLNADSQISKKYDSKNSILYSRDGVENLPAKNIEITAFGTDFLLGKMKIESGLLGRHNIGIVAAAVDFAKKFGLNDKQIRAGLAELEPFEHRMQPRIVGGATIIDDTYNGNLDGIRAGIELLQELPAKRKVYVTPGLVEQGDKTEENHRRIGRLLAKTDFDKIVLMKNSVTDFILRGLNENDFRGEILLIDDPLNFYKNLDKFVASGDVVLMQNDWTDNYF